VEKKSDFSIYPPDAFVSRSALVASQINMGCHLVVLGDKAMHRLANVIYTHLELKRSQSFTRNFKKLQKSPLQLN